MKKFVAMLLAVVMVLSCAALATGSNMSNVHTGTATQFKKDKVSNSTSAEQKTDVWLQVEASGTIDVTVPLVLVFKTNINGGNCDSPEEYKITNNSTAALKVTEVTITDDYADVTANGNPSNMEMVNALSANYDEYTLMMNVDDQYKTQNWTAAKNVHYATDTENGDGTTEFKKADDAKVYTIAKGGDAEGAGLWLIDKKKDDSNEGTSSRVTFTLATSKLSYVTHTANTEAIENDDEDTENGVKLFHVNYTVKIDDSNAVGTDIKGEGLDTDQTYSYEVSGN